jgi:anti-sigma-K factor RskA
MAERPQDPIEDLLPAYALNALDAEERELVDRALEREPRYQSMLVELLEGAAALADGHEALTPPATLLGRVMGAIDAEERGAPPVASGSGWFAVPQAFWGVAAVLVVAMLSITTVAVVQYQRLGDLETEMAVLATDAARQDEKLQQQAEITTLAIQPGVQRASMSPYADSEPPLEPAYGVVLSKEDGRHVLWLMHLEPLTEGMAYQVWLWDENREAHSLAVFEPDANGQAYVPMWMPDHEGEGLRSMTINVEPAGGSVTPSDERVLWGRLE